MNLELLLSMISLNNNDHREAKQLGVSILVNLK